MAEGIIQKPSQSDLQSTYKYLCDNPSHLDKINITDLRYLLEWVREAIPKELRRIEHIVDGISILLDGSKRPLSENFPGFDNAFNRLKYWEEKIIDRINFLIRKGNEVKLKEGIKNDKPYSQRQVAIAYYVLDIPLTKESAEIALSTYTKTNSLQKFLTKQIRNIKHLTSPDGNPTTLTKHLNDLLAAKRLISGLENEEAEKKINHIIKAARTHIDKDK
jgi:hypothetical protein